jgi:hypothetical protein
MIKYLRIVPILFLSICLISCSSFYPQPKPIDTLETFIDSVNNKDIDTTFSCLDPKYQILYNLANKFTNNIMGVNISDFLNLVPFMSFVNQYFPELGDDSELPNWIKLEILDLIDESISENDANVKLKIRFSEVDFTTGEILNSDVAVMNFELKYYPNSGWKIVNATASEI